MEATTNSTAQVSSNLYPEGSPAAVLETFRAQITYNDLKIQLFSVILITTLNASFPNESSKTTLSLTIRSLDKRTSFEQFWQLAEIEYKNLAQDNATFIPWEDSWWEKAQPIMLFVYGWEPGTGRVWIEEQVQDKQALENALRNALSGILNVDVSDNRYQTDEMKKKIDAIKLVYDEITGKKQETHA